jgi:hypothetical protein
VGKGQLKERCGLEPWTNFFPFKKSPKTECGLDSRIYGMSVPWTLIMHLIGRLTHSLWTLNWWVECIRLRLHLVNNIMATPNKIWQCLIPSFHLWFSFVDGISPKLIYSVAWSDFKYFQSCFPHNSSICTNILHKRESNCSVYLNLYQMYNMFIISITEVKASNTSAVNVCSNYLSNESYRVKNVQIKAWIRFTNSDYCTWIASAHLQPDSDVDTITRTLAVCEFYFQGNKQALLLCTNQSDFVGTNNLTLLNSEVSFFYHYIRQQPSHTCTNVHNQWFIKWTSFKASF